MEIAYSGKTLNLSYVEILSLLRSTMATDQIEENDRKKAIHHIEQLEAILWRYSD